MKAISVAVGLTLVGLGAWAVLGQDVSPEKNRATICAPFYAQSHRPSAEESHRLKLRLLHDAGISEAQIANYIMDHKIPICLAGDPTSLTNLQLQRPDESHVKDQREIWACRAYCAGQMTLEQAQGLFR